MHNGHNESTVSTERSGAVAGHGAEHVHQPGVVEQQQVQVALHEAITTRHIVIWKYSSWLWRR